MTLKVSEQEKDAKFSELLANIGIYRNLSGELYSKKMDIINSFKK